MLIKLILCFFLATFIGCNASGEFYVLHCPDSLVVTETEIEEIALEDIYSAMLGANVEKSPPEYGVLVLDPFRLPEAVVEVLVEGAASLGPIVEGRAQRILLQNEDEVLDEPALGIVFKIRQHARKGDIVIVKLSEPEAPDFLFHEHEVLGAVPIAEDLTRAPPLQLRRVAPPDQQFLAELDALRALTARVAGGAVRPDSRPDVYKLRFQALHALADTRGPNSPQAREAVALLVESLRELSAAFAAAYGGSVVVAAVASDAASKHWRQGLLHVDVSSALTQFNSTSKTKYDAMAMVHILVWLGAGLAAAATGIVLVFMDMDMGRDSVIYRKTAAAARSKTN